MIGFNNLGNMGRLGNQMFEYAALRGIAANKGYDWCIPPFHIKGIENYSFLRTSIYNSLKNIDFVIGMHTSVNLVSILFDKPTIIYPQVLTQEFMKQDLKSKQMYTTLNGFCADTDEFKIKFGSFLDKGKRIKLSTEDQKHLRSFFKDSSIDNIIKDLKM